MDGGEGTAEWALLLLVLGLTGWFWQDATLKSPGFYVKMFRAFQTRENRVSEANCNTSVTWFSARHQRDRAVCG